MKPSTHYPTALGLVWMLYGMPLAQGMVNMSSDTQIEVKTTKSGEKLTKNSPHIMIMPFPVNEQSNPCPYLRRRLLLSHEFDSMEKAIIG